MHHCLQIAEIRELIIESLYWLCLDQECLRLASTCKAFYTPAMDKLWESMWGLGPFLKCMPPDVLSTTIEEYQDANGITYKEVLVSYAVNAA